MEFIKEITESRVYRRLSQLHGRKVGDIAKEVYSHLLMLKVLYGVDKSKAQRYAKDMVQNLNFNGFRMSMPDLYNMIVMVVDQKKYADQLFNNWDIVLPEMRLKRIIRDFASGTLDESDYANLMLILQRRIPGVDQDLIRIRRMVSDKKTPSKQDTNWMIRRLLQITRKKGNSDLHMLLMTSTNPFSD